MIYAQESCADLAFIDLGSLKLCESREREDETIAGFFFRYMVSF